MPTSGVPVARYLNLCVYFTTSQLTILDRTKLLKFQATMRRGVRTLTVNYGKRLFVMEFGLVGSHRNLANQHHPRTISPQFRLSTCSQKYQEGQDANQYLGLDIDLLDMLDDIRCSPFGAVAKGSLDLGIDARVIHDLSFPPGTSVNDETVPGDTIDIVYEGASMVAQRLVSLRSTHHDTKIYQNDDWRRELSFSPHSHPC